MKKAIALMVLAFCVVAAVRAADYVPTPERPATDATWAPASVEFPAQQTIEVSPVVITARAPAKVARVKAAQGCSFASRPLEQGRGNVTGFCP